MSRSHVLPTGIKVDLDYFAEWRPLFWREPLRSALVYLGDLRGQKVLEIGGRSGRMASLLAIMGAEVTMLDLKGLETARNELRAWGVEDRVQLIQTDGTLTAIAGREFDVVFTKSVLWSIEELGGFLDAVDGHLASEGRIVFVENNRGGALIRWIREMVVHRGRMTYSRTYHGIHEGQFVEFRERFEDVRIARHRQFVYTIVGRKKGTADAQVHCH